MEKRGRNRGDLTAWLKQDCPTTVRGLTIPENDNAAEKCLETGFGEVLLVTVYKRVPSQIMYTHANAKRRSYPDELG